MAVIRKSGILEKVAFANLSLAVVSTIVAGAAGIMDNLKYYNGNAANHVAKIILASILFLITTITVLIRWRKPDLFDTKNRTSVLFVGIFCTFCTCKRPWISGRRDRLRDIIHQSV